LNTFPTLFELLFGSLMIEIEDNCLQIKQFMCGLSFSNYLISFFPLGRLLETLMLL
jgi:hypothetical protein